MMGEPASRPAGKIDSLPVLKTKLYRPPPPPDIVIRTELLQLLGDNRHRPLTLISAPAGYGKTTLASMWLESSGCAYAWLALDERDNDLRTFLTYLVAAVQGTFPDAELTTRAVLEFPTSPLAADLARYLLNDLDRCGEPFLLALDDVYLITEQRIYDLLFELLRHPLPTFHLVIITRRDPPLPIPDLRAHGQVTEVRARNLRFSIADTASLLAKRLNREIDEQIAAEWTAMTEGWVSAIVLAAHSLRYREPDANLRAGTQMTNVFLQDYFLDEILTRMSPAEQEWLFAASLLDRFCAPICAAMCQLDGSRAADKQMSEKFIQWLQTNNLFLVTLDDRREWFRFHRLFRSYLQDSLRKCQDPDTIAAYQRRASRWFAENDLLDEAIHYALAGGDPGAAVRLLADRRHDLMNRGQWHTLELWIEQFPQAVVLNDPVLYVTTGHLPLSHGMDWAHFLTEANRLVTSMPADLPERSELQGELAVLTGILSVMMGPPEQAIAAGMDALSALRPEALRYRCLAIAVVAIGYQMAGDYERSLRMFDAALRERQWSAVNQAHLFLYRSQVCFMQGDLETTQQFARESVLLARRTGMHDTSTQAHKYLGVVHLLRNELEEAETHLAPIVEEFTSLEPPYLAAATCALARIHEVRGRQGEADAVLRKAESLLEDLDNTFSLETIAAYRIELALQRGDMKAARNLASEVKIDMHRPVWYHFVPQLTFIKLLLVDGTSESLARARASLNELDEHLCAIRRNAMRIDVLALLALVCDAQGATSTSFDKLAQALELATAGGFVRNFLDLGSPMAALLARIPNRHASLRSGVLSHIDRILAAFAAQDHQGAYARTVPDKRSLSLQPLPVAPLTRREHEVLRLLATEQSPQEIADDLAISTATARTHIKSIYQKLEVHSRFEAVQRGRDLNLL